MTAEADESRVRALLRAHPDGREIAAAPFRVIASGALNRCWRAETAKGPVFVRLARDDARRLGADWESEAALLAVAHRVGLAPAPLLTVPAAGLLVSEFVPGRALTRSEARSPARLAAIARLLRELHGLAPPSGIRRLDFATQARMLESQLDAAACASLATQAADVFARLASGQSAPVPCHNDVHAENILEHDRRLLFVDWEYGGLGDPIYDLAACVIHLALDAAQRDLLLDSYGADVAGARLRDACWAYDYVQWLWYRVAANQPGDGGAGALAEAALAVARRLERSPDSTIRAGRTPA
jgi:thiamine kinase-like enzyme